MARPKKEINKDEFEKLCALQCTMAEICAFLDISDKTLQKWCKRTYKMYFSEVFNIKRQMGKISLRRNQMALSKKSAQMAIYLGEKWLADDEQRTDEVDNSFVEALESKAEDVWDETQD